MDRFSMACAALDLPERFGFWKTRTQLKGLKSKPVIHANPTRKKKPRLDRRRYALRYRVEILFHDLKRFLAIATRFEKTSRNYLAIVHLACSMVWLRDLLGGL